jgi:hypothetical protein
MMSGKRYRFLLSGLLLALWVLSGGRGDASSCVEEMNAAGSATVCIAGVQLEVEAPGTVPVSTEFSVLNALRSGYGEAVTDLSLFGGGPVYVEGELSGPAVSNAECVIGSAACAVTLRAPVGDPLKVPALLVNKAGNYVLDGLRLTDAAGNMMMPATPSMVPIEVVDKVLLSRLRTRPLSLDEIEDRGIIINDDDFTAYEFTIGVATESKQVDIPFDVVIGDGGAAPDRGGLPAVVPELGVANLDVQGIVLEVVNDLPGVEIPPIPGVIVIPGNIAFLNEFFQVLLLVSNVAPEGSELAVTDAAARLVLPMGANGRPDDPNSPLNDDPLRPAETANGGTIHPLCGDEGSYDPLLCTVVVNAAPHPDPLALGGEGVSTERAFGPGEEGQGEFLIEGRKTGTYQVEVNIKAELRLATGEIVALQGKAYGTVVVRNPTFALTFNHPDVVRAGETYSLFVTVSNVSNTPASLLRLTLDPILISGATLVGTCAPSGGDCRESGDDLPPFGTIETDQIGPKDAATFEYRLIARKNGRVTAAAFEGEGGNTAGFVLRTGIGDQGIPLSPDTLVLPSYAYELPDTFIAEALRVLGLAHGVATAPQGSGYRVQGSGGIAPIDGVTVVSRAQDLAEAGLRLRIRARGSGDRVQESGVEPEALQRELLELWLDWLGGVSVSAVGGNGPAGFDVGFDQIMRLTDAGHDLEAALAVVIGGQGLGLGSVVDLHDDFVKAEAWRGGFIAVAADHDAAISIVDGARVTSGFGAELRREVASVSLLGFDDADGFSGGQWAIIGDPNQLSDSATVTITAAGTDSTVHLALPDPNGLVQTYELTVDAGASVTLNLTTPDTPAHPEPVEGPTPVGVADEPPHILGVRQIPEGDPRRRGRVVAVLFDQGVDEASLGEAVFRLTYAPRQEAKQAVGLVQNSLKSLKLFPRQRILYLQFRSSVSRFFDYDLTIEGVHDPGGLGQVPASDLWPVVGDFPKEQSGVGGIVSGTVRDSNGDPLPFAGVELVETFENPEACIPYALVTGSVTTDENGSYRFDFVGDGRSEGCDGRWPFQVQVFDTSTGQKAERQTFINFDGEHRRLDLLMLGLGRVEGHVWIAECGTENAECAVAGATVTVRSLVDESEHRTTTDSAGLFTVENVAVGDLEVTAEIHPTNGDPPRVGSVAAVLEQAGATAVVEVLLFADTAAVEGAVFEESRIQNSESGMEMVPVGAGVEVVAFQGDTLEPSFLKTTRTDAAGHFTFTAVPAPLAGTVLHVRAFRNTTAEQVDGTVTLSPGATVPVNLILPGTSMVMGTVLHANGVPAAGAEVVADKCTQVVVADQHGNFVLKPVGAGHQKIRAQDPQRGVQGEVEVDVSAEDDVVSVVITLAGFAGIDGTLISVDGVPQTQTDVFLWFGQQGFIRTATDSQGRFQYRGLPLRGDYVLRAIDGAGDGVELPLVLLASSEIRPVTLQYRGVGTVTGVVIAVNADGARQPRPAKVEITYDAFDSSGRLQAVTIAPTADETVGENGCNVVCPACAGRFTLTVPVDRSYRLAVVDDEFAGNSTVQYGQVLVPDEQVEHCLVVGQSARLHGTVFLADGSRAGAGIEVSYEEIDGSNPREQHTDDNGEFTFTMLAPARYRVSARDPSTGNLGIAFGSLEGGSVGEVEINLLGQGTVRVHVRRPGGEPIEGAPVDLTSGSPVARLRDAFPTWQTDPNGVVEYEHVSEGAFSVTAFDTATGTGSRVGGQIVADQAEVTLTVIVGPSGTVKGHLTDATGTNVLRFAQVRLRYKCVSGLPCVKRLDDYVTSDENGFYQFDFVPLGQQLFLECFDPRTGRVGRYESVIPPVIDFDGDEEVADMSLIPVGSVSGTVFRPAGSTVEGAKVELRSNFLVRPEGLVRDVSFFGPGKLATASNLLGEYLIPGVPQGEFDLTATDPKTGAMGKGGAQIVAEGDTVDVDLTLDGRGTVQGKVTLVDGVTPVGFAMVVFKSGTTERTPQTDKDGAYTVADVPRGAFTVTVREQGGNDGGQVKGEIGEDGETVIADVAFVGTSRVSGRVLDNDGTPLPRVLVRLLLEDTKSFLYKPFDAVTDLNDPNAGYDFFDVPVGRFTVQATVGVLGGARTAALTTDGEHLEHIDITIEPSGSVSGRVDRANGDAADGAVVELSDLDESFRFFTLAEPNGTYEFDYVPLGDVTVSVSDPETGGVGTGGGTLSGDVVEIPLIVLDDTVPAVASISPADGTVGAARNTSIVITFTDLIDQETVNATSIKVLSGGVGIAGSYAATTVGNVSVVTFTPNPLLPEFAAVTVEVNQRVRDSFGRPIPFVARSSFQTRDETPPVVLAANLIRGWVVVRWSEAVALGAPYGPGELQLCDVTDPLQPIEVNDAAVVPSDGGRVLTLKPTQTLEEDRVFEVRVFGWKDVFGNAQEEDFTTTVTTTDDEAPTIILSSSAASDTAILGETVTITASPANGETDILLVDFYAAGQRVEGDNTAPFTHQVVAAGDVAFTARAIDFAGNLGEPVSLTISVRENAEPSLSITSPAEHTAVRTGLKFPVSVTAGDDLGLADIEVTAFTNTYVYHVPPGLKQASHTFSITPPADAEPDPNSVIEARAYDVNGKQAASRIRVDLRDGTAPSVRITSLTGSFVADPNKPLPVSVFASDAVGVKTITLTLTGDLQATQEVTYAGSSLSNEVPHDFDAIDAAAAAGGAVTIVVTATDAAGNIGKAPRITLTVQGVPTVAIVEPNPPAPPEVIGGSTVRIKAQAGNILVKAVEFYLDGGLVGTDTTAEPGQIYRISVVTPRLSPGETTTVAIEVEGIDVYGVHTERQTVTVPVRGNVVPVALAGEDRLVVIGHQSLLSAAVWDPDNQPYTCRWRLDSRPTGSTATLVYATSCGARVTPDEGGVYRFGLIVNDGINDSGEAFVELSAQEATRTPTPTETRTPTETGTPTHTGTITLTPSVTKTGTETRTATRTRTITRTPTDTKTPTATRTLTPTRTATMTRTATVTETDTPTVTSTPTPLDFRVNVTVTGEQRDPDVCVAAAGNFIVVWAEPGVEVRQRYDEEGNPWPDDVEVTEVYSHPQATRVGCGPGGEFVVVWNDYAADDNYQIYGWRLDAQGDSNGPTYQINTYGSGGQYFPDVAVNSSGDFLVVWESDGQDGDGSGVFARHFTSDGNAPTSEFQVNNTYTAGNQRMASVTAAGDDGFVVVWESDTGADPNQVWNIRARHFDASGDALGGEVAVAGGTVGMAGAPDVASHSEGNVMVVWPLYDQGNGPIDGDGHGILGRVLGRDLTPLNSAFQVNTYTASNQVDPHVASVVVGFVVVWTSSTGTGNADVRGQRFYASGESAGSEFEVNTYTTGEQSRPAVACWPGTSECVMTWRGEGPGDPNGIFGRHMSWGE